MDNSKEFNLMLDRAIEAHPGDFEGFDRTKNVQDQLQEMVGIGLEPFMKLVSWCMSISFGMKNHPTTDKPYWYQSDSREQLELTFVMEEKYNEVWDGENWINS